MTHRRELKLTMTAEREMGNGMSVSSPNALVRLVPCLMGFVLLLLSSPSRATAQTQDLAPIEPPKAWHLRLLPGQPGRVFSMYGCPGELDQVKSLVAFMEDTGLGNGFDPGPGAVAGRFGCGAPDGSARDAPHRRGDARGDPTGYKGAPRENGWSGGGSVSKARPRLSCAVAIPREHAHGS